MSGPFVEGAHEAEFIIGEFLRDAGQASREVATLTSGQKLVDGQLVQLTATKMVTKDVTLNTAGSFVTPILGIVIGNHDASATGTNADIPNVPYLARLATVRLASLVFPAGSSQKTEAILELKNKLNIIAR